MGKTTKKSNAIFLDRDGTLILERKYLSKVKDVKLFANAVKALKILKKAKYKIILVTNQSGIGRGYFTEKEVKEVHTYLKKMLLKKGVSLDAIYYCPHTPEDKCNCRKPRLGFAKEAQKKFNLDLKKSYAIGDKVRDFVLGQRMGGKGIFVLTGHAKEESKKMISDGIRVSPDYTAKNLMDAADYIVKDRG